MFKFAITFVNIHGEVKTQPIIANSEYEAVVLIEKIGYVVKSCVKIS